MKMFYMFLFLLMSCESKASNEMEALGEDVLKAHEGINIIVMPVDKPKV